MPRSEQDATFEPEPRDEPVVRHGNSGVPQSRYVTDDETPPPGPAEQSGPGVSVGPGPADDDD